MGITHHTVLMTILCGTILIVLLSLLRTKRRFLDICSVSGIIMLFFVSIFRLIVPIEFSWTTVIDMSTVYNPLVSALLGRVSVFGFEVTPGTILLTVWALGAIIFGSRFLFEYVRINKKMEMLISEREYNKEEKLRRLIGTNKMNITVYRCNEIPSPLGMGLIRKRILLPKVNYEEKEEKYILMHEYMHFRNKDLWTKLLINLICAIYWWNPCVYLLRHKLDECFELRCDQKVIEAMGLENREGYLTALLNTYKYSCETDVSRKTIAAFGKQEIKGLRERFILVADMKEKKKRKTGKFIAILAMIGIIVLSYSFVFQAVFDVPVEEVEDRPDTYGIDQTDSYIFMRSDGSYYIKTSGGTIVPLEEKYVEILKEEGFEVKK